MITIAKLRAWLSRARSTPAPTRVTTRYIAGTLRPGVGGGGETMESVIVPEIDAFLADVELLCQRYNYSIGHDSNDGAFVVEPYNPYSADWLAGAQVDARLDPKNAP